MHLTFLGTGSAFTERPDNYQSNMFIESAPRAEGTPVSGLLIDAGSDVRRSMAAQGLDYRCVDAVYVSHLHNDHVGGMEWLGFRSYFDPDCRKPTLIVADEIVDRLWTHSLQGGMEGLDFGPARLDDFFNVVTVPAGGSFDWRGATFRPVRLTHFITGGVPWPSFGLMMTSGSRNTFLTTDARFEPDNLQPNYDAADLILQDCETQDLQSDVHAHYTQLRGLAGAIKRKMWLYHYNDGDLPDAVGDGFLGFAKPGQIIDLAP